MHNYNIFIMLKGDKIMKKKFSLLLSCATMILGSLNVFGAVGLIVNNKTYVPVRGVFEELGFNVT